MVTWDGQSSHITRTSANIAMLRAQQERDLKQALATQG